MNDDNIKVNELVSRIITSNESITDTQSIFLKKKLLMSNNVIDNYKLKELIVQCDHNIILNVL